MKKSYLATILMTFLVVSFVPCVCVAYSGGTGTSGDPYQIATVADLLELAANKGDYNKSFILTADIDLDPNLPGRQLYNAAVIAADTDNTNYIFDGVAFTGTFNGAGHKIANLIINTNGAKNNYLGLFGYIDSGAEIKNLGIENVRITGGNNSQYLGGLAGLCGSSVSNCYSSGTISAGYGSYYLGGLIGYNNGGAINNCNSSSDVNGGDYSFSLGGLIGINGGNISNCHSTSTVTCGFNSGYMGYAFQGIGGLVGTNNGSIHDCHSTGTVIGADTSRFLGGLVGYNGNGGNINDCYSTSNIVGDSNTFGLGGLVGYNGGIDTITNSYSSGDVVGGDHSRGIGGLAGGNGYIISKCHSTGNVTGGNNSSGLGGLLGTSAYHYASVNDCYSTGNVTGLTVSFYLGGLVGSNGGDINNCNSTGSVTGGFASWYLGGFAGSNETGNIVNCCSTGTVRSGISSATLGGLVGGNYKGNVSKCYATGDVICGDGSSPLGGLVGENDGNISNCYSIGDTMGGDVVAGIMLVGDNFLGDISNCYVTCDIGTNYWFRLVGSLDVGNIIGCYYLIGDVPIISDGTPLTDAQMKQQSSFVDWDFVGESTNGTEDIWRINEGIDYPRLAWQPNCIYPSIPSGLSATDSLYTDHIRVSWNPASDASGYEVFRNTSYNSILAEKLGEYTSPFDDYDVNEGTVYYYWIKAKNSCWISRRSSPDSGYASTSPMTGNLKVTIEYGGENPPDFKWNVDGGAWQNSDVTVTGLSIGLHKVNYIAISGWITPPSELVIIYNGQTTTTSGFYTQNPGNLQVTLSPVDAVAEGAQWSVDGGGWQNSGVTITGLSVGSHMVNYNTITGWIAPPSEDVIIKNDQTTSISRNYTQQQTKTGNLKVTLGPAGAVSAGAQWNVDGGGWQNSGNTVSSLSVGSHTVSYKSITGWDAPLSEQVTISSGQTAQISRNYTQQTSQPNQFGILNGKNVKTTLKDVYGNDVMFSLSGGGYGEVTGEANFEQIILYGTGEKSQLTISTKGKTETSVGDIIVKGPLKGISGKNVNLRGGISVDGSLGMVTLNDIAEDHTITVGTSSNPKAGLTVKLDQVGDLTIDSGMPIKSISATEWVGGAINAPSVGSITIKGDKKRSIPGDFDVNVTLDGSINSAKIAGTLSGEWACNAIKSISAMDVVEGKLILSQQPDPKIMALGKLTVKGWIDSSQILSQGNIGTVTAGKMFNSCCFSGIAGASDVNIPDGVLDLPGAEESNFDEAATIKKITIKGIKTEQPPYVINSNIAGAQILSATLSYPDNNNVGVPFGLSAGFIKSLKVKDGEGTVSFKNLDKPSDADYVNDVLAGEDIQIRLY